MPEDPSGPVDVWVLARDAEDGAQGRHRLTVRQVRTLESLFEVRGPATVLRAGAGLKANVRGSSIPRDPDKYRDALTVIGGRAPSARFVSESGDPGGPWLAQDYHSLAMATFYHHVEAGRAHFEALGGGHALPDGIPTWYTPSFGGSPFPPVVGLTDNAGYLPTLHGFLLFERAFLAELPLPLNGVVVTHELSHAMFEGIANGGEGAPAWIRHGWPRRAANLEASLNEGLADLFAALQYGEPDILGESASEFSEDRHLEEARILGLFLPDPDETPEGYDPYPLGTLIASALWAESKRLDDPNDMGRAALVALAGVRAREEEGPFTMARFIDPLLAALPPAARGSTCATVAEWTLPVLSPEDLACLFDR